MKGADSLFGHIAESISRINNVINDIVWGVPMLILIIGTGIFLSIRLGFFQIFQSKLIAKETLIALIKNKGVTKTTDKKAISQFQALSTALAATLGTGNIAGVATAMTVGGPGAVFWMWLSAFFGMMTLFSENVLGIYYRKKNKFGEWSGGSMYYIEEGLKERRKLKKLAKPLALMFAVSCVLASFGIGNMAQVNSISDAMETNFGIKPLTTGFFISSIVLLVIFGGIKRISAITEKLVPFAAFTYIVFALITLVTNVNQIPYVFCSIFKNAFDFSSVAGGISGFAVSRAISMGFKRGVFSNEAGLGSSVMVHSSSDVKEPVKQGMWGIFAVFFDTIVVCTLTAFILLSSSSAALPLEKVLKNITTEVQYFSIGNNDLINSGIVPLIDTKLNKAIIQADKSSSPLIPGTALIGNAYGKEFVINTIITSGEEKDNYTYTNIMAIKGNKKVDNNGNIIIDENGNPVIDSVIISTINGVSLVSLAFSQSFGGIAGKLLAISVLLFALSTVLGWSHIGAKALEYILGTKGKNIYKFIYALVTIVGATASLELAWSISDTLNAFMAIPNLIALISLSGLVARITNNYINRRIFHNRKICKPLISAYKSIQDEQEYHLEHRT